MKKTKRTTEVVPLAESCAKLQNCTDLSKVIAYFEYTLCASTRMVAYATHIKRGSICWYVRELEEMGILAVDHVGAGPETGRECKFYKVKGGAK